MPRVLRPLALGNVAAALLFAVPLLAVVTVQYLSRGSLEVTPPAISTDDQALARIKTYTNIEDLRREATFLAEMRAFTRMHQDAQSHLIDQLFQWFWVLLGIVSALFLANAGVLYWAHVRAERAL